MGSLRFSEGESSKGSSSPNQSDHSLIPASFKMITNEDRQSCVNTAEIVFAPGSQIREICGFNQCPNLRGIEIPSTAEIVKGFTRCRLFCELIIRSDSHLQKIVGFSECPSFLRSEIPSSVTCIKGSALPYPHHRIQPPLYSILYVSGIF
jgi:hypothetical protein